MNIPTEERDNERPHGGQGDWYVAFTKPRMEPVAITHLERQHFECYGPRIRAERLVRKKPKVLDLPLFPRYVFLRPLLASTSLYPVRSTLGVTTLVTFGPEKTPGKVPAAFIEALRHEEARRRGEKVQDIFRKGEKVLILDGPFKGLMGVYDLKESEERVRVLIDFLGKAARLPLPPSAIELVEA